MQSELEPWSKLTHPLGDRTEFRVADVFISYAHSDIASAELLSRHLESAGIDVWYDMLLVTGDSYVDVLKKHLDQAKAVIVIWSEGSLVSDWVNYEARAASQKIVPVATADTFERLSSIDNNVISIDAAQELIERLKQFGVVPNPETQTRVENHTIVGPSSALVDDAHQGGRPAQWIERLAQRLKGIGRIERLDGQAIGTGFLVKICDEFVLLTCNHVIADLSLDRRQVYRGHPRLNGIKIRFDSLRTETEFPLFLHWSSSEFDVAVIRIRLSDIHATSLASFALPVCKELPAYGRNNGKRRERVFACSHSESGELQVSLEQNLLQGFRIRTGERFETAIYSCPNDPSSSGGPVLTENLEVLAIHRGEVAKNTEHHKLAHYTGTIAVTIMERIEADLEDEAKEPVSNNYHAGTMTVPEQNNPIRGPVFGNDAYRFLCTEVEWDANYLPLSELTSEFYMVYRVCIGRGEVIAETFVVETDGGATWCLNTEAPVGEQIWPHRDGRLCLPVLNGFLEGKMKPWHAGDTEVNWVEGDGQTILPYGPWRRSTVV